MGFPYLWVSLRTGVHSMQVTGFGDGVPTEHPSPSLPWEPSPGGALGVAAISEIGKLLKCLCLPDGLWCGAVFT